MTFDVDTYNPFSIKSEDEFNDVALKLFHFQYQNNAIYKKYVDGCGGNKPINYLEIPFLPIEFFKTHKVVSADQPFDIDFKSSGTTGVNSTHFVKDKLIYETSFKKGIHIAYPEIKDCAILALLPNYLEQENSSLVYMVDTLIAQSKFSESGFYLNDIEGLVDVLKTLEKRNQSTVLIGVSFALLDLIEQQKFKLNHTIIMETGGMKGRRKEIVRSELHQILCEGFGVSEIHSEYGMTELLSQAYSHGEGVFQCPPWMKVLIRDVNDPFQILSFEKPGGINVIDLANIYSCAFVATQDLGKIHRNSSFEVIGRFDISDVRGCNLMVE
ncbi:MAG: acyl transferase [Flavobacteriales bacterium]|nr:acyl transferase [Flavobacteriales bacterium]